MQCMYNCIPEILHVSRVHSVAAVLYLQFALHAMLYLPVKCVLYIYTSIPRSMCSVPNMAVLL
jgi:hypothetical protein